GEYHRRTLLPTAAGRISASPAKCQKRGVMRAYGSGSVLTSHLASQHKPKQPQSDDHRGGQETQGDIGVGIDMHDGGSPENPAARKGAAGSRRQHASYSPPLSLRIGNTLKILAQGIDGKPLDGNGALQPLADGFARLVEI